MLPCKVKKIFLNKFKDTYGTIETERHTFISYFYFLISPTYRNGLGQLGDREKYSKIFLF